VLIDSAGQLGTISSSKRFKEDIKPMDVASESVLALKPVTFHYKTDTTGTPQFGLIAEEVAKVNPDLVVRDKEGKPYTVRYDQVNAMLLNEFLKEHHQVQDLKAIVAEQQEQIKALTAGLQKVSAQLEVNKPSPQTILNNQ
jgi:trimeric autotransporter adhesin